MRPIGNHRRVSEYDGAFRCYDCDKLWGAVTGHPPMPEICERIERRKGKDRRQSLSQEAVRDETIADAARYRWLQRHCHRMEEFAHMEMTDWNAEIDSALKREPNAAAAEGPAHGLPCWPVDRPAPAVVELIAQLHDMAFALEKQGSEHWAMNCGYAAALLAKLGQGRYSAPFKMIVGKEEWVQIRFVSRAHIHDKPTEANPSPIRVILMHELERAQPAAMAYPVPGASDE